MRIIWSNGRKTRMMPGPFGVGSARPSRKITARSYSRRILMELRMYSTTMAMTIKNRNGQIGCRHGLSLFSGCSGRIVLQHALRSRGT